MRKRSSQSVRQSNRNDKEQRCVHYLLHSYKMIHLITCTLVYFWMFIARTNSHSKEAIFASLLYAVILYRLEKSIGGYKIGKLRISYIVFLNWVSLAFLQFGSLLVEWFFYGALNILSHISCLAILCVLSLVWAFLGNKLALTLVPPLKTIIIYDRQNKWDIQRMDTPFPKQLDVIGSFEISCGLENIQEKALEAEVLYLYRIPADLRHDLLKFAAENKLYAYVQPVLGDLILNSTQVSTIFDLPVLHFSNRDTINSFYLGKRVYDILVSLLALLLSSLLCYSLHYLSS